MKILVLGNRYSGKSTVAGVLSDLIKSRGGYIDTSTIIIQQFAAANNLSPGEIAQNKESYRDDLFNYARSIQEEDPAYFVDQALGTSDIVCGVRNKDEVEATKHKFDLTLWIDRSTAERSSTEMVGPEDADVVVDNDGTISQLRFQLEEILRDHN